MRLHLTIDLPRKTAYIFKVSDFFITLNALNSVNIQEVFCFDIYISVSYQYI